MDEVFNSAYHGAMGTWMVFSVLFYVVVGGVLLGVGIYALCELWRHYR